MADLLCVKAGDDLDDGLDEEALPGVVVVMADGDCLVTADDVNVILNALPTDDIKVPVDKGRRKGGVAVATALGDNAADEATIEEDDTPATSAKATDGDLDPDPDSGEPAWRNMIVEGKDIVGGIGRGVMDAVENFDAADTPSGSIDTLDVVGGVGDTRHGADADAGK